MNILPTNNQANVYTNYGAQNNSFPIQTAIPRPNIPSLYQPPMCMPYPNQSNPMLQVINSLIQVISGLSQSIGQIFNSLLGGKNQINDCGNNWLKPFSVGDLAATNPQPGNSSIWGNILDTGKGIFGGDSSSSKSSGSWFSGILDFGKSLFKKIF
jgi:hypothetical protein